MQYVGGKFRQRRDFVPAILADTDLRGRYFEPFIGGGSMFEHMAPHFERAVGADIHEDLILMYRALQSGWTPPDFVDEEEYSELRSSNPSALRGFVGFGCSFGGKWFGGYARNRVYKNYAAVAGRSVAKMQITYKNSLFVIGSYDEWRVHRGTVVYADPPYKQRNVDFKDSRGFDHDAFWRKMQCWAKNGVAVYVSEFSAPRGWECIAESIQRLTIAGNSPVTRREQGLQHDRLWKYQLDGAR